MQTTGHKASYNLMELLPLILYLTKVITALFMKREKNQLNKDNGPQTTDHVVRCLSSVVFYYFTLLKKTLSLPRNSNPVTLFLLSVMK